MTTLINARIDAHTKKEAVAVLHSLGLTMSQAISAYLRQIILTKSIPFELKMPNEITLKTHNLAKEGKNIKRFDTPEELFKDIEI